VGIMATGGEALTGQHSYRYYFMIAFDLQCSNGHTFEGWFEDSKAYEKQEKKGLIACPVCNDAAVSKVPSAFSIKSSSVSRALQSGTEQDLMKIGNEIADYVKNSFDDVGADFTSEALKMHYGVVEPRNIRGVSSLEEEKTLKEEGIQFFKIPLPVSNDTD